MSATLKERTYPESRGGGVKGWYAAFSRQGMVPSPKEVTLGTKNPKVARVRFVDLERREALGAFNPWTDESPWKAGAPGTRSALTVDEAQRRFVRDRARTGSPSGVATYTAVLRPFVASLPPGLLVAHLTPKHVAAYVEACRARGLAPASVKAYRDRIGIFARWLVAEGLAPKGWAVADRAAPASKAERARDEAPPPKSFEAEEYARLVAALRGVGGAVVAPSPTDAVLADVVEFTFHTGFRRAEACALRWGAVDLAPGSGESYVGVVPSEGFTPKSGRRRVVALIGGALDVVRRRRVAVVEATGAPPAADAPVFTPPGRPGRPAPPSATLHGPSLTRRIRVVSKAAGLRDGLEAGERGKALHSLRHSFGTNAVTAGVAVQFVQAAMGHGRIETTQGYAKVRPAGLHAAFSSAAAATAAAAGAASAGTEARTDAPGAGKV